MNLVCFSNNTAGGLVCDLLNGQQNLSNSKTSGAEHNVFKIGNDAPTIQTQVNVSTWNHKVHELKHTTLWYGTHAHPSCIPDLTAFESVIAITTVTRKSKLYRWLRYYNVWFKVAHPLWVEDDSLEKIDKIRELAKNVFVEFAPNDMCENIEFADIVSGKFVKQRNLNTDYMNKWLAANPWLLESESWAVKRFNEAEWELERHLPYPYL
jgi:hypothetical protein